MFPPPFENDPFKKLREAAQKMAAQSIKIEKTLAPISAQLQEIQKKFASISIDLNLDKYKALFEALAEEAKNIPDRVDTIYSYLAQRGWFVPFHFADFGAFKKYEELIKNDEHEIIENDIQQYIKNHTSNFKHQAKKHFPDRFKILSSAFEAHENQKYELSIPVLLAQADGMFEELIGTTFYSNKEKQLKKIKRRLLEKLAENGHPTSTTSLSYLLLKQFEEESLLHENFSEIEKRKNNNPSFNPLNRNTILHGRDIDYANEANSLRTIALIGLLCNCKDSFEL